MFGLGTLINAGLILAGGMAGLLFGRFLTPCIQDALPKTTAVANMPPAAIVAMVAALLM